MYYVKLFFTLTCLISLQELYMYLKVQHYRTYQCTDKFITTNWRSLQIDNNTLWIFPGLYGKDTKEAGYIDMISDAAQELFEKLVKLVYTKDWVSFINTSWHFWVNSKTNKTFR